jgi:hypothetical protein
MAVSKTAMAGAARAYPQGKTGTDLGYRWQSASPSQRISLNLKPFILFLDFLFQLPTPDFAPNSEIRVNPAPLRLPQSGPASRWKKWPKTGWSRFLFLSPC